MSNFFSKIGKLIGIIALSTLSGLLGSSMQHQTQNVGSTIPIAPSVFETYLASQMSTSDTSMTLASSALRDATTLNGYVCFTIDSNTSVLEYTCGTATAGSQTITGLLRGIDPISGTSTVASLTFAHRRGADVKITDYPILSILGRMANGNDTYPNALAYGSQVNLVTASSTSAQIPYVSWVFNNFMDKYNTQTIAGLKTFTTLPQSSVVPAAGADLVNKTYADGLAIAGAPNASLIQKGIVQEATPAQISAFTQAGSTGADLFINPFQLQYSTLASTTASTTAYAQSVSVATTTRMTAGTTALVMATIENTNVGLYLFAKQSGYATSTLAGPFGCSVPGGSPAVDCPVTLIGTYSATNTQAVTFSVAQTVNSNPATGDGTLGGGGSFTIMKFASSTAN